MNLKGVAAALGLFAASLAGPASAACALNQIGEMKIEMMGGLPTLAGSVNGKPFRLLVTTGANASSLTQSAVERLGLKTQRLDRLTVVHQGKEIVPLGVRLPSFNLGGVDGKDSLFLVNPGSDDTIDGTLGNDFFQTVDIEFDFSGGALRIFRPKDCGEAWLAYWGENATVAPLYRGDTAAETEVEVNGRKIRAELSSGTATSLLSLEAARAANVGPEVAGAQPAEPLYGGRVPTWFIPVDSFAIGDERISRTRLRVGDVNANAVTQNELGSNIPRPIFDETQMELGADFFASHRIMMSNSQRRLWITYLGGGVFRRAPAQGAAR